MKKLFSLILASSFLLTFSSVTLAGDVEFVSTGEGDIHQSDEVIADDPYAGKTVPQSAYEGSKKTQKPYTDECKDDMCRRAKQRQMSEGTTWREDVKSGLHKGYGTQTTTDTPSTETDKVE